MALVDLFRPKWRHSNPSVRLSAVKGLANQAVLAQVAKSDSDLEVREAAAKRLTDLRSAAKKPAQRAAAGGRGGRRAYLILLWNSQKWSASEEAEIVRGKTAELGCPTTVLKRVQVPGPFPRGPDSLVVALALRACQEAGISFQSGRDTISFKGGAFAPGVGLGLITILVAGSAAS